MRYRRRKKNIRVCTVIAIFFAAAVVFLTVRAEKAIRPVAEMQAQHFAEVCADTIIQQAAADYLRENELTYNDFAAVLYNEGRAVAIETIPCNINMVQSGLALTVNRALGSAGTKSERIPVGSLTGSYLLAGRGPSLKVRVCPVGKAEVEIRSAMESAGVNQTRHRISAVITAEVASSLPLYSFDSQVSFEFLLAETVIVGDVPLFSH